MAAIGAFSTSFILPSSSKCITCHLNPRICFLVKTLKNSELAVSSDPNLSTFSSTRRSVQKYSNFHTRFSVKAASSAVDSSEYIEEPATKVKFPSSLVLPGCSTPLSLLGTGYREKVFAIIGVKVYAAGIYVNQSVFPKLDAWKGRSPSDLKQDSAVFDTIFKAPLEKSLHIVLVRDVDGKTFWNALDEAISPRIKLPTTVDESALSTFRRIFTGRPLKKGTSIFLTWPDSKKMLVSVSSEELPSIVGATIESINVSSALFDVFLGDDPVSPTLKSSVASGLAAVLK